MALVARRVAFEKYGEAEFTVIISEAAASYVAEALCTVGLNVISTHRPVQSIILMVEEGGHLPLIRLSKSLLAQPRLRNKGVSDGLPRKLYISRRGSRSVLNEVEVYSFLQSLGYERVYPEDLRVEEQIRLLANATDIVAIHGAALGPLILRSASTLGANVRLVELFGAGFLVSVFREIVFELSGTWIGVRGALEPDIVGKKRSALYFEKDAFSVDIDCLSMAIEASHRPDGQPQHRWDM
jgi:hypothetical protein